MKKLLLCLLAGVDTGITFRPPKRSVFLSAVVLANHPHQLLVGAVVYSSDLQFGEIVERGRTLARDVYTDYSLVSVDDAQHRLQLQESHIAVAPVGNGILLSEHVLVDGDIHRLVNQTASLGRPRTMVVDLRLTVEHDLLSKRVWNMRYQFVGRTDDDDVAHERVVAKHVRHPSAARHDTLPLRLLHIGMVVEHYQRERFAETRHPILREIMEVARIDEVQRLGRIRRQSAAQLRPRLLIAIAVDAADVAAVDVRDVGARSKRLVVVHARKVEKYNRLFCYHGCKGRYFLRRRANRLKN